MGIHCTGKAAMRLALVLVVVQCGSGCASTGGRAYAPLPLVPIYIETTRGMWLMPHYLEEARCVDGQPLVCLRASGRLGSSWCHCPMLPGT